MVRSTEKKNIAMEKRIGHSQVPRAEGVPCHAGPHREAPGLVGKSRWQGENVGKNLYCAFPGKDEAWQGKQV